MPISKKDLSINYVTFLYKWRLGILILFVLITCGSIYPASQMISKTTNEFNPPGGSTAEIAQNKLKKHFPTKADLVENLIYVECTGYNVVNDNIMNNQSIAQIALYTSEAYLENEDTVTTYANLIDSAPLLAPSFVGGVNSSALLLTISTKNAFTNNIDEMTSGIKSQLPMCNYIGSYGSTVILSEGIDASKEDIERMDMIVLPIAFIIVGLILRSPSLWILTLFCLIISIVLSFAILCCMIDFANYSLSSAAPSVMMSLTIAICIDYGLFLLVRLKENMLVNFKEFCDDETSYKSITRQPDILIKVIADVISSSGHTILSSGSTLSLCFIALIFFPVQLLSSMGVGVLICILMTMFVNLCFIPTILLACPRLLIVFIGKSFTKLSFWQKWSKTLITHYKSYFILAIVLILSIGISSGFIVFNNWKINENFNLFTPRNSQSMTTLDRMSTVGGFSPGVTGSFTILMSSTSDSLNILDNEEFWNQSISYLSNINTPSSSIISPMYSNGVPVDIHTAKLVYNLNCSLLINIDQYNKCQTEQFILHNQLTTNAGIASVIVDYVPTSTESVDWLKEVIYSIDTNVYTSVDFSVTGITVSTDASITAVYNALPIICAITLAICICIIGFVYKSMFVALRAVLTICLTLLFAFAFGIGFYVLDWGDGRFGTTNGLCWIVPPMAFTVILGLGLDYDVFLIGRIIEELKKTGKESKSNRSIHCIRVGVWKTGHVITIAGLIMSIAFSGLFLSNTPMLNQVGVLLVSAVLFDTFIVRSFFTPAVMSPFGKANWWPRRI